MTSAVKSSFFYLRQLTNVRPFLCNPFITNPSKYCNTVLWNEPDAVFTTTTSKRGSSTFNQHQKKHRHITPVIASFHWLPVCFRADFKILSFALKCLQGCAPQRLPSLYSRTLAHSSLFQVGRSVSKDKRRRRRRRRANGHFHP